MCNDVGKGRWCQVWGDGSEGVEIFDFRFVWKEQMVVFWCYVNR